jgi:hypothetical protein
MPASKGHAFPLVAVPAPLPKNPSFRSFRSIPFMIRWFVSPRKKKGQTNNQELNSERLK